jgi:two-component system, sensor histidine kinase and response regulator
MKKGPALVYFSLFFLLSLPSSAQKAESTRARLEKSLKEQRAPEKRLEVYLQLSEYYEEFDPTTHGLDVTNSALALADSLNDKLAKGKLYRLYGQIYNDLYQQDYEKVLGFFRESFRLLTSIEPSSSLKFEVDMEIASTLNNMAYLYWQWGQLKESLSYYDSAIRFTQKIWEQEPSHQRLTRMLGLELNSRGAVYWGLGNHRAALESYLEAIPHFDQVNSPHHSSLVYNNIGLIYDAWGQKKTAFSHFHTGLKLAKKAKNPNSLGYSFSNLGRFHEREGHYDSALFYYQNSAENYLSTNNMGGIGYNLNGLGNLLLKMGDPAKSQEALEKALAISQEKNALYWVCRTQYSLANLWLQNGQLATALKWANSSRELADKHGYRELEKDINQTLSEIYEKYGNIPLAYYWFKEYVVLKDSLFSEEKFRQITRLNEEFEVEKTLKENELLKLDSELQRQNLKRANWQKYGLVSILGIAGAFLVYFLISRYRMNAINKALTLQRDEIIRQKEEISQKSEDLEKSNEVKDMMLSILSHDLRSPLSNLESMVQLLQEEVISIESFKEMIPQVAKSLSQVSTLTDNLLYWVNSQLGGLKMAPTQIKIQELIGEKFGYYEKMAEEKGIHIQNHIGQETEAWADPYMIELIIRNLLSNAIKFCSAGDTITLTAEVKNGRLHIVIADTGKGMEEGTLRKLSGGQQLTTQGTNKEKGAGLGLLICRQFVDIHGGKLHISSTPSAGSTFVFDLPVQP